MSCTKLHLITVRPVRFSSLIRFRSNYTRVPNPKIVEETKGYLSYARNVSRDRKYEQNLVAQKGDTPTTFFFRRLGHAYETYPLFFLIGFWATICTYCVYLSANKIEIWLDRSQETAPWDWSRVRENYWKKPTTAFDLDNRTHQRLEIMEKLQDEMLEAAKKRGTR
ncbi:unnamed protein product, partial [Mesorhabditis belari]|uniref:Uncharacterized protein n=1 Tax=Mesorhabditis belari TaxID=2138241 RepID=A0AAF3J6V7_9BILA